MSGTELENHRIKFDCDVVNGEDPELPGAETVTVNPFVPSLITADDTTTLGRFPNMTLFHLLDGEGFERFEAERHQALSIIEHQWPSVRMAFRYYLQGNAKMLSRVLSEKLGMTNLPGTEHERTTAAYHALGVTAAAIVGLTNSPSKRIISRFAMKHSASTSNRAHLLAFRERGATARALERDLFTEVERFIDHIDSWEMGRLLRFVDDHATNELQSLVLYRNEFSVVRDLYQHGFEIACKCLWPLVAAQNTVKRGNPDEFGDVHPDVALVPVKQRPSSLKQFDGLTNARKVAYVALVPGWESFAQLLNNRRRNTIGHATAHHDLTTGRVVSDIDHVGITYLDFLAETFGVFEAVTTLAQVLRAARVAASPDFFKQAGAEGKG